MKKFNYFVTIKLEGSTVDSFYKTDTPEGVQKHTIGKLEQMNCYGMNVVSVPSDNRTTISSTARSMFQHESVVAEIHQQGRVNF